MVLQNEHFETYCEKCYKVYTNIDYKWCKPCKINYLKSNFTSWTSGNEKINNFIQQKQLKIDRYNDVVFEWIPYNQFYNIKKSNKDNFVQQYGRMVHYIMIATIKEK